jgi:aminoglycoside phosphotransferase (APT) family kinase protein
VSGHHVEVDGDVVTKRFNFTDVDQPDREWQALHVLAEHAPGLAPEPIRYVPSPPAITMTRLPGVELSGALSTDQLDAMIRAVEAMFRVPAEALPALECTGRTFLQLDRVRELVPETLTHDDPEIMQTHRVARAWLACADTQTVLDGGLPAVLGRGDYNLSNFLWDGEQVRMLDFEYAGWTDRGTELGMLMEHIATRGTPDSDWLRVVAAFELSKPELALMTATRRAEAIFWFGMLLPGRPSESRNPPGTLQLQAKRLLELLS